MKRRTVFVAISATGIALLILLLYFFFFNTRFDAVVEGRVYRSAQLSEDALQKVIKENHIRTILNLMSNENESEWFVKQKELAANYHIALHNYHIEAHALPEYRKIAAIVNVLEHAERPILIHCKWGADRSGLISALALSIEKDLLLEELKRQFSWKYGVFPFSKSVGPLFFSAYEAWLTKKQKAHSNDTLIYWIMNEYADDNGNLQFYIDSVNDVIMDKDRTIEIARTSARNISIKGWTFDLQTNLPADNLSVVLDGTILAKAQRKHNRPDVLKVYNLEHQDNFVAGWEAEFDGSLIASGCHRIWLQFVRTESEVFRIPTKFTLCIDK